MIFPAIEKHKQLYSTEDWLFTCMRILVVAGSVAFLCPRANRGDHEI